MKKSPARKKKKTVFIISIKIMQVSDEAIRN